MPRNVNRTRRITGRELLLSHWRPPNVAQTLRIQNDTAYRWDRRIRMYGQLETPGGRDPGGRPPRLSRAARDALLLYQRRNPHAYQDELAEFLQEEWGITVHRSTISRVLKDLKISRKKGERTAQPSQLLRDAWQEKMHPYSAEQLVIIDESLFKLQSGWRAFAYAPIGEPARYHDDMRRGET